jgi:predicted TIM-barrel fold metal-dependent hydrolase
MLPIIDAHHHIWDLEANRHPWLQEEPPIPCRYGDYHALRRDYLPADLRRDAARQEVIATVYMEAEHDPADPLRETRWVHEVAAREGLPDAMASAAFLDRADAAEVIRAQAAMPLVRSLRHKPKGVARAGDHDPAHRIPGSLRCPAWRAGYRHLAESGLHFELQTPWWYLPDALELARDFPDTLIILNHLGLPADRSAAGLAAWREAMARLAEAPNLRVKLSGCCVPGRRWTPDRSCRRRWCWRRSASSAPNAAWSPAISQWTGCWPPMTRSWTGCGRSSPACRRRRNAASSPARRRRPTGSPSDPGRHPSRRTAAVGG